MDLGVGVHNYTAWGRVVHRRPAWPDGARSVSFSPLKTESASEFLLHLLYCDLQFFLIYYCFYACTGGSVLIFQMHTCIFTNRMLHKCFI